ncbi:cupin domain-containing protein [Tichowtungia aerotolerans]|uniref:Cupin domain-containing protein n=2 Tax=Tichowtungia aerotolerans TaxID=2697043 RepID=A0A6P1M845_9BACT|nr:cupin domain-containing protein [Tichowtungia aerotolerans]
MRVAMNLLEKIPESASQELLTELLNADGVRIERIVSFGQCSPDGFWYDQDDHEWVLLVEGSATLGFENGPGLNLKPGDFVNIPAGQRHRVEKTDLSGRTVWLAVFYENKLK